MTATWTQAPVAIISGASLGIGSLSTNLAKNAATEMRIEKDPVSDAKPNAANPIALSHFPSSCGGNKQTEATANCTNHWTFVSVPKISPIVGTMKRERNTAGPE